MDIRTSKLKHELESLINNLGFSSYFYISTSKASKAKPTIISNYPELWLEEYKSSNYHLIDPVINHGLRSSLPFTWDEALEAMPDERSRKFFQLSSRYQICQGATFVLHDAVGLFAALSVCNARQQADFGRQISDHSAQIQMALIHFHDRVQRIQVVDELVTERKTGLLSVREIGVLKLVVMGKAYCEVSEICAISVRTVKFHMSNISKKLQVSSAKQVVYEAKRQGII